MTRWSVGILLAFATVLCANAVLVWYATHTSDPIDPTYAADPR